MNYCLGSGSLRGQNLTVSTVEIAVGGGEHVLLVGSLLGTSNVVDEDSFGRGVWLPLLLELLEPLQQLVATVSVLAVLVGGSSFDFIL